MKFKVYYASYMGYPTPPKTYYKKLEDVKKLMNEKFEQELIWKDGLGFLVEYGYRSEKDFETGYFGTAHAPWLNSVCSIHEIELEIVE